MKLEQSFEVAAPLQRVWEALVDVERVAPCLPGAAVTGRNDDGSYNGTFTVKIGPTSAAYSGKLQMEHVDESAHSATMQAQGTDKRGQGGAKATIVSSISEAGNGATKVEVSTDYHITGRLARFGRGGMIEDISTRLLNDFANCLQTSLAGPAAGDGSPDGEATAGSAEGVTVEIEAVTMEPPAPADGTVVAQSAAGPGATAPDEATEPAAAAPASPPPAPVSPPLAAPVSPPRPINPPTESEPVEGLSLMASVLWGQAKRNPAPVAALLFGLLLALRLLRRGH